MYFSQHSQKSQFPNQDNTFPSVPEYKENWAKVSYERGRPPENRTVTKAKHGKEGEYWLSQPQTSTRFAVLQQGSQVQQITRHRSTPKPPAVHVTGIKSIPPLTQPLEHTAGEQYETEPSETIGCSGQNFGMLRHDCSSASR
jgi:hypothetical protein